MEPPVHKTVFIAPKKKKKRVVTGHGKQKSSASNASIVRRIHSYDVVTSTGGSVNLPDQDEADFDSNSKAGRSQSSSTLEHLPAPDRFSSDIDVMDTASASSPLVGATISKTNIVCDESTVLKAADDDDDAIVVETPLPVATSTVDVNNGTSNENYLTLTGTIRRGKKDGQSIDVTLNMSREELEKMEAELSRNAQPTSKSGRSLFGVGSGVHVFAFSLLVMPFVMLVSTCYAFYWGTFTWYNVYLHFSEERGLWHRVLVCPLLVLTYPFQIPPVSLGVGAYAALAQVSWRYDRWQAEVQDLEKGFFGWACAALHLVDCAPYQVVVLNDVPVDAEKINIKSKVVDTTTV